jgi:hypothetical protein
MTPAWLASLSTWRTDTPRPLVIQMTTQYVEILAQLALG